MHRRFSVTLFFLFITYLLMAQDMMVQGTGPDLHLLHSVAPKENWYSVGRLFNISPKEIAPYNALTIDMPLNIGQQLKIPLSAANFSQNGSKEEDEVFVPVYHMVQEKEWMFRISSNYNKVPLENLEKWNNVSRDQAKAGMKLIVGYLKVKKAQSPLASGGNNTVKTVQPVVAVIPAPVVNTPEKKAEPVARQDKIENAPPPVAEKAVLNKPAPPVETTSGTTAAGGYFKAMYGESGKAAGGAAGIFKSISGWQDGKYYALMNNVPAGTIVRISNPSNNKAVYAKVLSQLPDMKESAGLTIRISDAAAAALGSATPKFMVDIKY